MNLFGLEGIGFIISLAMTLLISGAIMFYCLRRFKVLETNLIEQGNVLKSFIMKQQSLPSSLEKSLASPLAVESAKQQSSMAVQKIEVSDDSDTDDYDSSYNESSECCNNDDINIDKDSKQITLTTEELDTENLNTEHVEVLNLDDSVKMIQVENMTELVKELSNSSKNNSDEDVDSNSDSDNDEIIKEVNSNEELTNKLELVEFVKDNLENGSTKKMNISKMRVDELRELVVQESKETSENVKNMKKEQLIKLLKEK